MSFSSDVKNELTRITNKNIPDCKAELYGLYIVSGMLTIKNKILGLKFSTDKAFVARRVVALLKKSYNISTQISVIKQIKLKKNNRYIILTLDSPGVAQFISDMGLISTLKNKELDNGKFLLKNKNNIRAFLRGVFLGIGNITDPKVEYHIEFVLEKDTAELVVDNIKTFEINVKMLLKEDQYIVYINTFDGVIDFLNVIGAHISLLEFENVNIIKEMRNDVNRKVNCETANLNKTVKASMKQIACIRYLDSILGLTNLPDKLREAAEIRLEHPESSLNELVEFFGEIGKAGINHRLKKICELAEEKGFISDDKID